MLIDDKYINRLIKSSTSTRSYTVLLKFIYAVDSSYLLYGSPDTLPIKLGIKKQDFNEGIRELKVLGFIRKYSKFAYMLNPRVISKRDNDSRIIYTWEEETILGFRK